MSEKKTCYFAHHITDYGTAREHDAIRTLEQYNFEVINPNAAEHEAGYRQQGMPYFLGLVATCDALAFQRFPTNQIGAGVGKEIAEAVHCALPTYEVIDDAVVELTPQEAEEIASSSMSVEATRALLAQLRTASGESPLI